MGEPYVKGTRPQRKQAASESTGLGLGFFIAKTLLERSGGHLAIENRVFPQRGAVIRVTWPRDSSSNGRCRKRRNSIRGVRHLICDRDRIPMMQGRYYPRKL